MKNRRKRVEVIVELIKKGCISSQEELARQLAELGFNVTQATLSRDLKMLHTSKVPTERGTYVYVLPDNNSLKDKLLATGQISMNANYQSGFISLAFSGDIAVIKTRNGYAMGLAYDIDMSECKDILGTIAGANTIFVLLREGLTDYEKKEVMGRFVPNGYYIPPF